MGEAESENIGGKTRDTHQKAFYTNRDPCTYGSFAEIGAGQEVARWFFRVGAAAGTIAKTMSAYDMAVSDDIYGKAERYVSRKRLQAMLDHEYALLGQRLSPTRGSKSRFFAFADTVATRGYQRRGGGRGWMGIRFQTHAQSGPSDVIIHFRLLDRKAVQQQEAVGIMGVNLVYGALYLWENPDALIASLRDALEAERVEVDTIKFSGSAFAGVDNRLMCLHLVQQGLTSAALFTPAGDAVQPTELLYDKPILVARGSFRPITKVTVDMLRCAFTQFIDEPQVEGKDVAIVMEMTLKRLTDRGEVDTRDFLDRVDTLQTLGRPVMVSNFAYNYELAVYFQRYTRQLMGMVLGLPTLVDIFDERHYADLDGGILESFGRMFKNALRLYVYPVLHPETGRTVSADTLEVAPHLRHLYAYLLENRFIQPLQNIDETCLPMRPQHVLSLLQAGDPAWETMVPQRVAALIKERKLFNYRGS